jgi:hypothetical protein
MNIATLAMSCPLTWNRCTPLDLFCSLRTVAPVPSADNPTWSHRGHHIGTEGMPFYGGGN